MNSPSTAATAIVPCMTCGQSCQSVLQRRIICRTCYEQEPIGECHRCGHRRRGVTDDQQLCYRCREIVARPIESCHRCGRTRPIYNATTKLCHQCDNHLRQQPKHQWLQDRRPCSVCNEVRPSVVLSRDICMRCYLLEKNGLGICMSCSQEKAIFNKRHQLCKRCYEERRAPVDFQRYVTDYTTAYPYNKVLFDLFLSTIDRERVDCRILRQTQAFGKFLQHHRFAEPVSWEALNEARPPLQPGSRSTAMMIRASLFTLGNHLASFGQLDSREAYIARRSLQYPIRQAPVVVQEVLQQHAAWLEEKQTTPKTIYNNLQILAAFWNWSWQRGISALRDVDEKHVKGYFLTLHRQWRCCSCQNVVPFDPSHREPPAVCPNCNQEASFLRIRRYARSMACNHRGALRRFFSWALVNRLVAANPVTIENPRLVATIRHYDPRIVEHLCVYMKSPEADPTEALVLCLIIFHAFSTWELNHVQLPPQTSEAHEGQTLAELYFVVLPRREASIGDHSPGRPSGPVHFHHSAAQWLKPLLERFMQQRAEVVRNAANRYVFVSPERANHDVPTFAYPRFVLQRVTERILGTACQPQLLRKTIAVMLADRAGGAILQQFGWDGQQAYQYTQPIRREVPLLRRSRAVG